MSTDYTYTYISEQVPHWSPLLWVPFSRPCLHCPTPARWPVPVTPLLTRRAHGQWRYINHTFEHAKGQQLQTALDQLYALLQDAEQQQHQRHAAALAAHSAAVQRLLADALRDACLGTDAVSAFGTAHAELARAVAGSCNRMPLDGVHVADEGALAQELQRSAEVLRRLQDAAAPVRDPVLRLCRAVEELGDAQGRVAEGLQGLFGALAAQRARTERECSVLVGRIQGLEAQVRAACPGASDPLGGDGPSPAPPPTA